MPFRPELNFFYLYLKKYLEEKYKIRVERGDSNILTKELLKKVSEQISESSLLIADITGANANVFFELGIAYEKSKPVIFLTQDDPKDAPVDTRQFEFIRYDLAKHEDLLAKLDNAVRNVLGSSLDLARLYDFARDLLRQFNADSQFMHEQASKDEFHARVIRAAEVQGVPDIGNAAQISRFLLPKIIQDASDSNVMQRVTVWLKSR